MKKNILVTGALILAAVIFVTSGICVFAAEKNSFPPAGVYFARHEHYTAWTDSAYNPYFTLQVYEVKGGERFLEYEDILLRDENGKDYSLKDASIQVIFSDVYFTSYRLVCVLDKNNLPKDETVFTYAVMRGTEKNNIFPIGRVTVSIGDCNSALTFAGATASAEELQSYNVKVTNAGDGSVTVTGLDFSLEGIRAEFGYYDNENRYFQIGDGVRLAKGDSVILHCTFEGNDAFRSIPFSEFKPLVVFRTGREEMRVSVNNKATYFAALGRAEIKNYLRGLSSGTTV